MSKVAPDSETEMSTESTKESIPSLLDSLKKLLGFRLTPRYLPEKHYMRGPGPACAAKARMTRGPETR